MKQQAKRHAKKPTRSIRVILPGILRITIGGLTQEYLLREVGSDFGGRGFVITEAGEDDPGYHVHVGEDGASCDCLGHEQHGHCKHSDGISKLIALRLL